jgi:hypothetical protein
MATLQAPKPPMLGALRSFMLPHIGGWGAVRQGFRRHIMVSLTDRLDQKTALAVMAGAVFGQRVE